MSVVLLVGIVFHSGSVLHLEGGLVIPGGSQALVYLTILHWRLKTDKKFAFLCGGCVVVGRKE